MNGLIQRLRLRKAAELVFQVQPGELRRTAVLFFYLLLGMNAFILGRTIRDTLFLTNYKVSNLPLMYVAVAVVVALVAVVYSRIADSMRRENLIFWIDVLMAGILILCWALIRLEVGLFIYPALYILIEIMGSLLVVSFWTYANDIFTSREAKRLFGIIGAGGVFANVVSGFSTTWLIKGMKIPTHNLLLLTALYLLLGSFIIKMVGASERGSRHQGHHSPRGFSEIIADFRDIASSRHLFNIMTLMALMSAAITVVDYIFKITAKQTYTGDQLTLFFSWFVGITGVLACLMQFLLTGRLMERYGVLIALMLLPIGMGSGVLLFIPTAALFAATVAQSSNYVFRYTINDATMQLLYIPVNPAKRGRAKAFIDGMVKQTAIGLTGLCLFGLTKAGVSLKYAAIIPAALIIWWIYTLFLVKREYLASLMETLRKRSLDIVASALNPNDEGSVKLITELLSDPSSKTVQILNVMDLIPHLGAQRWARQLITLTSHEDPRVRNRAIELLGAHGWGADVARMMKCLQDPDEQVRATAIMAFCQILKERAVVQVRLFLRDPNPMIRAAAVSGLIKYCGLDGILEAAEVLKKLLENTDPNERFWGAAAMRQIAVTNFYRTLFKLLGDRSVEVQKEAIAAAGEMRSAELIPALVYKLGFKGTSSASVEALAKYGEPVLDTLKKVLSNPSEKQEVRLNIPRVMVEIGSRKAIECLVENLRDRDEAVRIRVIAALARIRKRHPEMRIDNNLIKARIIEHITAACQCAVIERDMGFKPETYNFLQEALEIRRKRSMLSVLKLLEVMYPDSQMNVITANLVSTAPSVRANAIEAIDNLVPRSLAKLLIPLLEQRDPAAAAGEAAGLAGIRSMGRDAWLAELLDGRDTWITVSAINEVKSGGNKELLPAVAGFVRSPDPVVREISLMTITENGYDRLDRSELERLKNDSIPQVAECAKKAIENGLYLKEIGDDLHP